MSYPLLGGQGRLEEPIGLEVAPPTQAQATLGQGDPEGQLLWLLADVRAPELSGFYRRGQGGRGGVGGRGR